MSADGGPAFPIIVPTETAEEHIGMSLRDYFAAAAMQGMLASTYMNMERQPESGSWTSESRSAQAYEIADAMLKQRAKLPASDKK